MAVLTVSEHQVVGPPGTGKTTYLSRQVVRAAEKFGASRVVVASLTRAAAEEVGGRDTGLHRNQIGTLHSHAFRSLDRPQIAESKEGIASWNAWVTTHGHSNLQLAQRQALDPENAPSEGTASSTDGDRWLSEVNVLRQRMVDQSIWKSGQRDFMEVWNEWKDTEGWIDFTDLIERAIDEVEVAPGDPAIMMLDEAQDMSRLEFTLARKWGAECEQLVTVGDPFQNLYEWRGSDPDAFDADTEPIILKRSWRVPAAVHEYAVNWARQIERRFPEYLPRLENPNADPESEASAVHEGSVKSVYGTFQAPTSWWRSVEADLATTVTDWRWDGERMVAFERPATVMILGACGYMLPASMNLMRERGLPFNNPYRPNRGDWNPLRAGGRLAAFLRPDNDTWGAEAAPWTWDELRQWVEPLKAQGVLARGAKGFIDVKAREDRFGESREPPTMSEVMNLLADDEAREAVLSLDTDWWARNLLGSREERAKYSLRVKDRHGGRALVERPRVIVGTIHSVKGGQADFVYLFPDVSNQSYFSEWFNQPSKTRESIVRQFYVAMTRAREGLRIVEPKGMTYVPLPRP